MKFAKRRLKAIERKLKALYKEERNMDLRNRIVTDKEKQVWHDINYWEEIQERLEYGHM